MGRTGHPEWDINDRCTTVPEIVGEPPPDIRREQGGGLAPYQPFEEWAAEHGLDQNIYNQTY
jgi:hypothetical protein